MKEVAGAKCRADCGMTFGPAAPWIALTAVAAAVLYIGVCWIILTILIAPARKSHQRRPSELGFESVHELSFRSRTGGVTLRGWLVPAGGDLAVILVHGLHSHAWDCQTPDLVRAYQDAGFTVLLFDLRAQGASGGERAGAGLLERGDLRAAVDVLLTEGFEPGRIGIHGTSYGAAVALLAAPRIEEFGAVIADSSFSSALDAIGAEFARRTGLPAALGHILLPGLRLLGSAIYGFDIAQAAPAEAIALIEPRPVLLIHGTDDPIIPYDHALRLKAAAGPSTVLWPLAGAEHTQGLRLVPDCEAVAPTREAYLRRSIDFFRRHLTDDGRSGTRTHPDRPRGEKALGSAHHRCEPALDRKAPPDRKGRPEKCRKA